MHSGRGGSKPPTLTTPTRKRRISGKPRPSFKLPNYCTFNPCSFLPPRICSKKRPRSQRPVGAGRSLQGAVAPCGSQLAGHRCPGPLAAPRQYRSRARCASCSSARTSVARRLWSCTRALGSRPAVPKTKTKHSTSKKIMRAGCVAIKMHPFTQKSGTRKSDFTEGASGRKGQWTSPSMSCRLQLWQKALPSRYGQPIVCERAQAS